MAYQQTGSVTKSTSVDTMFSAPLKIQMGATATPTILAGKEILGGAGSVVASTSGNALLTVTLNCPILDVPWVQAEYRDDAQTGNYCTVGNISHEASSSLLSFKVGFFLAAGTAMTASQVNTNAVVVGINLVFRNTNANTGS
jgi:hypothetical protein